MSAGKQCEAAWRLYGMHHGSEPSKVSLHYLPSAPASPVLACRRDDLLHCCVWPSALCYGLCFTMTYLPCTLLQGVTFRASFLR